MSTAAFPARAKACAPALFLALAAAWLLFPGGGARALEGGDWAPLLTVRFGNIDAIDAEDGPLALFLKGIRNDGRFIPPMRTLVAPGIRNPTFFGLTYEAWVEGVFLSPAEAGATELVWVFPVDNRDEYIAQLANQGLSEYEGMDDVSTLREIDPDGNPHTWYLEWLPGSVAVFGGSRPAVAAARQVYAENSAAEGLLAAREGSLVSPDVVLRLDPARLAGWQSAEAGVYWWRETMERLVDDLLRRWNPNPARARLVDALAGEFIAWPLTLGNIELGVWFEDDGVEWRLRAEGPFRGLPAGRLEILRSLPERTAAAYGAPVTPETFEEFVRFGADLALGAAGGVVSQDAKAVAEALHARVRAAGAGEAAWAWVAPPAGRPELGGARLLLTEWENPDELEGAWADFEKALAPDTPLARAVSQLGWEVAIRREESVPRSAEITIFPSGSGGRDPLYSAVFAYRRRGGRVAVAGGTSRVDGAEREAVAAYRASLAEECVSATGDGSADVRSAFTRVERAGAGMAGFLSPVRFLQLALVEAADWRPRSPDQLEPVETQLAREMLEYSAGDAWTAAGVGRRGMVDCNGGISWRSLSRLCAALGITEAIGMD